jgi:DNA-binding Lrp family transcriptional regulator
MPLQLDTTDHALLDLLQRDRSATLFALGQEVGLSTSAVQRRIERYRKSGLIDREVSILDAAKFPDVVIAIVMLTLERESAELHSDIQKRLLASPAVQQCYDIAGAYDYAVLLVARGMDALRGIVDDLFVDAPNLKRFDTFMVYRVIRSGLEIPTH